MSLDILIYIIQAIQEIGSAIDGPHILDLIGVGTPGASAVYFYFSRKELKEKDTLIQFWQDEADKYQGKWVEAVEEHQPNT